MTDPVTPQIPTPNGNAASEMTKMLFSPVNTKSDMPKEEIKTESLNEDNVEQEINNQENWLKNEDYLIKEAKSAIEEVSEIIPLTENLFTEKIATIEETKVINPEIKTVIPEIKTPIEIIPEQKIEETITTETKPNIEKIETSPLEKDMQIIENIQKQTTPLEIARNTPSAQAENVFNLDSITVNIPSPQTEKGTVEITKPQIPENPYDNLQKIIPQIVPSIKKIGSKESKYIGIGVIIILVILGWFVVKTMYPIQYEDGIQEIVGEEQDTIIAEDSTPLTGEILETGDSIESETESGNILLDSGNSLLDSGMLETLTGELDHSAAETELEETTIQTNEQSIGDFKIKLETFVAQGKMVLEDAKKTNNKEAIKYSTALYKKSETHLQKLANGEEISTDEMTNIIGELSGYLTKISPNTNVNVSTTEQTETTGISIPESNTTTTSGGDFNPDNFFGK